MKIKDLHLYNYTLPLKMPITIKGHEVESRSGFILKIVDSNKQSIYSEVAPLPHLHQESLEDVKQAFYNIHSKLVNSHWSLKLLLADDHLLKRTLNSKVFPSLYFGLEFAILSLLMPRINIFEEAKVNALLSGTDLEILEKSASLDQVESIKLKVGQRSPKEVLKLIDQLQLSPQQKLRIDINRQWDLPQVCFFCNRFPEHQCEYLEEPLKLPADLLQLSNIHNHPIAFDESLLDTPIEFLLSIPTKKALVIKPSLIGSIQKIHNLFSMARKHRLKFVLSSCFESGLGHLMIAHLSHYLGIDDAMGLDSYSWFKKDILKKPITFKSGMLNLKDQHFLNPYLDLKQLTAV